MKVPAAYTIPFLLGLMLILGLASCGRGNKPEQAQPANRAWSQYVAGHTAGLVSRNSSISIRFARDVIDPAQVGKSADKALEIQPRVDGKAVFTGTQELTFTPSQPLKRGQGYLVRLKPKALKDVPEKLGPYEFNFTVMQPAFEIKLAALESAPDDDNALVLRGVLETADAEDAATVEKLLAAEFRGTALGLQWAHFNENRTHQFSAGGLERQAQAMQIKLSWNGEALGVKSQGNRQLEVPPRGVFKVLDSGVLGDGRQAIRVNFSERLDPNQNLNALVTLGSVKITTRIDGSTLTVYPETPVTGDLSLNISEGIRNARGTRLDSNYETTVTFANERPQVRFAGKGVILPDNETLSIAFEGMNIHSVQVTAFQVYESNIGQFLQDSNLGGTNYQMHRVGRHLWRKTLSLPNPQANRWTRYSLDASELLRKYPRSMFRLSLSINRGNSSYACSSDEKIVPVAPERPFRNNEDLYEREVATWDGSDEYYEGEQDYHGGEIDWADRDNPCKDAYFRWAEGIRDERNFLASDIGLLAKRGSGGALHVVATSLRDAKPLSGVDIEVRNFQNQVMASGKTDGDGFADIDLKATPFYLVARRGEQAGYLKLNRASALPVSHFDSGGETLVAGLKGFIYGERGVWRPGDDIFLNFVLLDRTGRLPQGHPATIQLYNPKGQLTQTLTNTKPVDDFYAFALKTPDDAPTGTWTAKVLVGGAEFTRPLKIETVMPNRLKMSLKFDGEMLSRSKMPLQGKLWAQWLHGASASGLKADISAKLEKSVTRFPAFGEYSFDDPARSFSGEREIIFEERLGEDGSVVVPVRLEPAAEPPGMMRVNFTTRVFENGGAFSTGHDSYPYSPYAEYVGLRLPKPDLYGSLPSGKPITVEIGTVNDQGVPVSSEQVEISVYRIDWRWWWERSSQSSEFAQAILRTPVSTTTASTRNGRGTATFTVQGQDWGRYLVRACHPQGGHCSGQISYIGWTGWDNSADEQAGPGASALRFSSDKPRYSVGETAAIQLPASARGRALLTVESGTAVLEQRWLELAGDNSRLELPITARMAPNVFVSLTLLQPHAGKDNDRPIRLYGLIPLEVLDPETQLAPVVTAADLWRPKGKVAVEVSEKDGREMTYTLAVVDEGLLGLTSYKTPNPHESFYKREALGVQTWDLFDEVAGAYGGELERLLALGGDQAGVAVERQEQKRFPPVVRVLGPFRLPAGESHKREIDLPEYIGEVRVMVVAGHDGAYGMAEKSIVVREPLSLLATLPRVLGPGETLQMPVSVFAYEPDIREVTLKVETGKSLEIQGGAARTIRFERPGEQMVYFGLKVKPGIGKAQVVLRASAGAHKTQSTTALDVRPANPPLTRVLRQVIEPGQGWSTEVRPFGFAGTNSATLEVTGVPPVNLERRLGYLVRYPHGCIEQTTSSVFPQLYLDKLAELDDKRRQEIETNIKAGIERLRSFQLPSGGFAYWPGNTDVNAWGTNYAGHFLAEAKRLGFHVPAEMFDAWIEFQRSNATAWSSGGVDLAQNQSYRLLSLALADRPEVGAMNRLRETRQLDELARMQLATAYAQIGLDDAARDVMRGDFKLDAYATPGPTYGSTTRDRGILLNALVATGDLRQAERVAEEISKDLASDAWYSTQSTAYALLAMARFAGDARPGERFDYSFTAGAAKPVTVTAQRALSLQRLSSLSAGGALTVKNLSKQKLYAHLSLTGTPLPGEEQPASGEGVGLEVGYAGLDGVALDVSKIRQGTDFVATVTVTNRSGVRLDDLALTQIVASGWEIHNPRFEQAGETGGEEGEDESAARQRSQESKPFDYQDIRDDRVMTYFALNSGESRSFRVLLNASYLGRYYVPGIAVESMYDARKSAQLRGTWTDIVSR